MFIRILTILGLAYFKNIRVHVAALGQQVAKTCSKFAPDIYNGFCHGFKQRKIKRQSD